MKNFSPTNENITSGHHHSYWSDSAELLIYTKIDSDKDTDVLVIGGGIAGLTTAYCLAKSGKKVILLEDGYLGSGESGRTTAQITYALDDRYYFLEKFLGKEKTKLAAQSHLQALDWIENTVHAENIDCNFTRVDGYLFLDPTDKKDNLYQEYTATQNAGLPTEVLTKIPGITAVDDEDCIKFPQQGQFHIMRYLKGLAEAIIANGGQIYTQSRAEEITKEGAKSRGCTIKAKHIVVATNSPVNDRITMHTKQWPYRSYVIAGKIPKGILPYAMWWDTGNQESKWVSKPYHYVRLEPFDEEYDLLISGGEDHKTGQAQSENIPEEDRYTKLTEWTKKHFPSFTDISYKWSGQVMEPVDSLAFIGKNPGNDNIYIITGDSGNGMTHGTIGGLLLNDLILGKENPWTTIYEPSRISFRTADDFIAEAGNMVSKMAKGWLGSGDVSDLKEIAPGEGAILSDGLKKVAAFRDKAGIAHTCSAVCPHLGGVLQWNNDEKSFDCPLHGSRFSPHGKVMNGPAISDLPIATLKDQEIL